MTNYSSIQLEFDKYGEFLPVLATVQELRFRPTGDLQQGDMIKTSGNAAFNDGIGGDWVWDPNSQAVDDGASVIAPFNTPVGRWLKAVASQGVVENEIGTATNLAPSQAAVSTALNNKAGKDLATVSAPGLMSITDKIKANGYVDPKELGARGNGSFDDRGALNDSVDAIAQRGGGVIRVPAGDYRISQELNRVPSGVLFEGAGKEVCYLTAPYGDHDVVVFGSGTTSGFYSGLRNLTVRSSNPNPTAGAAVVFDGAAGVVCENVRARGHYYGYHWRNNAGTCRLYNSQVEDTVKIGQFIESATDPLISDSYCFGTRDGNGTRTEVGLYIRQMNGGRIRHSSYGLFDRGIVIAPNDGEWCLNPFFDCVEADLNYTTGVHVTSYGTGYAERIKFIALRTGFTSNGPGLLLEGYNTDGIMFIGGEAERCIGHGVVVNGARGIVFNGFESIGNNFFNNGSNSNVFNGYSIQSGDEIEIIGGRAGRYSSVGHTAANPNSQNFGIGIESTFTGKFRARSVDCTGNKLGAVIDLSNNTNVTFGDIPGFTPSGPNPVTVTASPFAYKAGNAKEVLFVRGGTVSNMVIGGVSVATTTNQSIPLQPHQTVVVTYSAAPTISSVKG